MFVVFGCCVGVVGYFVVFRCQEVGLVFVGLVELGVVEVGCFVVVEEVYFLQVDEVGVKCLYVYLQVVDFQVFGGVEVVYVFVDVVGGYVQYGVGWMGVWMGGGLYGFRLL